MAVLPISAVALPMNPPGVTGTPQAAGGDGFAQYLTNALDQANQATQSADQLSAQYAAGGPVSVDQLMIAEQKASMAVDLVVQVRNRVVSAYQSIMNMQV